MTGLINLISEHASKLNILLIVSLMNIIIAVLLHFLTNRKIIKYIPSFLLGIGAILILLRAFNIFTTPRGLDLAWIAVFLGTAALVGLFVSIIIDLISSIRASLQPEGANSTRAEKKSQAETINGKPIRKVSFKKPATASKVRVAKKRDKISNKDTKSKYNTSKIYLDSDTKKVKAIKIDPSKDTETITFESDSIED